MTEKGRGSLFPVCQIPVCRFVRQPPQRSCSMGCRVGNRSSHGRSFRARNERPEWENTDRPLMRSTLCNNLAASSGRRDERGRPVTNQFEGTGVVLGAQLTRRNLYTELAVTKVAFSIEFHRLKNTFTYCHAVVTFRLRSHIPVRPVVLGAWDFA
jgi:hypothetical protein